MSKLLLLFLTLIVGLIFLLIPGLTSNMIPDPFLFHDFPKVLIQGRMVQVGITFQAYFYMIIEHLLTLIFVGIIAKSSIEYRHAIWVFFWLHFLDLIDFLLTYNSVWYRVGRFPLSMNVVMAFVFGWVILNELWKKSYR